MDEATCKDVRVQQTIAPFRDACRRDMMPGQRQASRIEGKT